MKKQNCFIRGMMTFSLLGCLLLVSAGEALAQSFKDVPTTHPNYKAIEFLKSEGVIGGYSDGTFKPSQVVNRAEALKMIFTAKKAEVKDSSTSSFKDVKASDWFNKYIEAAKTLKVVSGNPDGTFAPGRNVNKAEFLKMFLLAYDVRFVNYKLPDKPLYADTTDQKAWFIPYLDFAKNVNIIAPNAQNKIEPSKDLTRAEVAEIVYKFELILKGGPIQLLLSRAEAQLMQSMFDLQNNKLDDAEADVKNAKGLADQALKQAPDQTIVKAAVKVISAFENLISGYKDATAKNYDSAITKSGLAYNAAEEAKNINAGVDNLSTQVKTAAKALADSVRAQKAATK